LLRIGDFQETGGQDQTKNQIFHLIILLFFFDSRKQKSPEAASADFVI